MAEAPTGDEQLTLHKVLDELLDAQTKSIELGRALKIPNNFLDGIHKRYPDAKNSLHCVIYEFLKQEEPKPTWEAIVAALRSSEVSLLELARKIEAAHCHSESPAATHVTMSEASSNFSPATRTETSSTQTSATKETDTALPPPSPTIVIISKVKEILANGFKCQYSEDEIKILRKWCYIIKQWQKTAKDDFKSARQLWDMKNQLNLPLYNLICFLTFDCIEKALKAAMIAGCILKEDDLHVHTIIQFVNDLAKIDPQFDENLKSRLEGIEWNCYNTRWPNSYFSCRQCKSPTCIPSDHFDETEAKESLSLAEDIVDMVDNILETHFKKMEFL